MKKKIKNVLFVSFLGIACTTGNIFCAKIQEHNMLNNENNQILSTAYKEEINNIKNLLLEQIPIKQSPGKATHEASKKLENVGNKYWESAKYIEQIDNTIAKTIENINQEEPQKIAQSLQTLSSILIRLRNQNTGAFYAVMNVIDVRYETNLSDMSISEMLKIANTAAQVNDEENLISKYLTADPYENAIAMLDYLKDREPTKAKDIEYVKNGLEHLVDRHYNGVSFYWQSLVYAIEDFGSSLYSIKADTQSYEKLIHDKVVYDKVMGIVDREYKYLNTISALKAKINNHNDTGSSSADVQDPHGILESMTAFSK